MSKFKKEPKKISKKKPNFFLQPGDLIDIIAPGSATEAIILENCVVALKSWGYQVRVAANILVPELFLSNSDEFRYKDLKKALLAQDSKAIWCLRGGYGSIRLLPLLNTLKKPKQQKLFIGISDVSSLHLFLNQQWNWPTLHGPLIDRVGLGLLSIENSDEMKAVITGRAEQTVFDNLIPLTSMASSFKKIEGPVIGGNLMVITSSLGTANQIRGEGKILFFEEMSERGYRIDRCLQQMKQAGVFKKVKAVVLGDFIKCQEPNGTDLSLPTLIQFFQNLKLPAFSGVQSGHAPLQRPLFFNTKAQITKSVIDKSCFQMVVYNSNEVLKPRK